MTRNCLLRLLAILAALACLSPARAAWAAQPAPEAQLLKVSKIWDTAPHNAFTDLVRFKDRWYCTFREGKGHVSPDGAIRVITSSDGEKWESAARLEDPRADLRDPKLTVTPDHRLMLNGVAATPGDPKIKHRSMVWFSADGKDWGKGVEIGEPNIWLWRPAWHGNLALGVGYGTAAGRFARLYASTDGVKYETRVEKLHEEQYPNEAALAFRDDGSAWCLLRRDAGTKTALLGTSSPPYKEWNWKDLGKQVGGPSLTRLPDGRLLATVRLYDKKVRTSLCWIDPESARLTEFLPLPSGGDTSYAGMVLHDGLLWVSYYASHEAKTSIYLAKVKLPPR
jgi:hypothetical protein